MLKRTVVAGALGGVVLVLWTFVANVVFGFTARVQMNQIAAERAVYKVLKEAIVAPGVYIANPDLTPRGGFPAGEPVFSVLYSGVGHEAAGYMFFVELALAFAAALLAAGLLSAASPRVLSRYAHKVQFIAVIGLLLAVFRDLPKFGIGGFPLSSALWLGANDVASWTLAGLAIAWPIRAPEATPGVRS